MKDQNVKIAYLYSREFHANTRFVWWNVDGYVLPKHMFFEKRVFW
jgi:hypothetical protein